MLLSRRFPWLAGCLVLILVGCAPRPPATDQEALQDYLETNDPLEPTNRKLYAVNEGFQAVVLRPLAEGYRYAVPEKARDSVHNALANLASPVMLGNEILQAKPRKAGTRLMRFIINSTLGVGGLFDVATSLGYPEETTDFGLTLATWGVGEGPFLFLPVIGPSDFRDGIGLGVNAAMDPFTWLGQGSTVVYLELARYGMTAVDLYERNMDSLDSLKKSALDPYATLRSVYRQHRRAQVEDAKQDDPPTIPIWFPQPPKKTTQ
jgi:phospholipid-binding lipoprotein MlaA